MFCAKLLLKRTNKVLGVFYVKHFSTSTDLILKPAWPEVLIPKVSTHEYVFANFHKYEKLTAIECAVTGRKYSYSEVRTKAENFSKSLRNRLKLNQGDVIAILLPNVPEFPIAALGAFGSGLVVTTINPTYTPEEISRQLKDSDAKAVITLNELWPTANAALSILKQKRPVIAIKLKENESLYNGAIDFHEFTNKTSEISDIKQSLYRDLAFLPYSSGTTGLPKGVELTHHNVVTTLCQNRTFNFLEYASGDYQEVAPCILPMFHILGFKQNSLMLLEKGAKIITVPQFTPNICISMLAKYKPTFFLLVPPLVLFLATHPEVKSKHLESLKTLVYGAAPLGPLDEKRFLEKAKREIELVQGYGLTEASTVTLSKMPNSSKVTGSIGRPISNTFLKIVDPEDITKILPAKTPGEILVKGPQVMRGYHNRHEETKKTIVDGWLRTGDMAYYNEENHLFITDRIKELIKVKGFQVAPAELEEIIRDFPNVAEAAVVGVPHESFGEVPKAFVVPKKNAKINVQDLQEYFSGKVAKFKQLLGGVEIVSEIPKTASGKILRRQLKERAKQ